VIARQATDLRLAVDATLVARFADVSSATAENDERRDESRRRSEPGAPIPHEDRL